MSQKYLRSTILFILLLLISVYSYAAENGTPAVSSPTSVSLQYQIGVDDIIEIDVLQPQQLASTLTVAPDGTITFPYIGSVQVKGCTLADVQQKIQAGLMDYMKYPVVSVSLTQSRSRMFYVYGEVNHPDSYVIQENMTVVQAISVAGGFTKVASTNDVKILRHNHDGSGSNTITVRVSDVMSGKSQDVKVEPGDVITVPQKFF